MPDKMIRVAGRGEDGTAKAVKTDDDGRINIKDDMIKEALFESGQFLDEGQRIKTAAIDSRGFLSGRLSLGLTDTNRFRVYLINIEETTERPPVLIHELSTDTRHVTIDYPIMADSFKLEFENISSKTALIQSSSINT